MSTFTLKCPGCGVWLEADENDVGATAECVQGGKRFILTKEAEKTETSGEETVTFSFEKPADKLEYTRPVSLIMPNGTFPVKYWSDVHLLCLSYAFENNPDKLKELLDIELPFRKAILFTRHPEVLRKAVELGDGIYAEINLSAHGIVKIDSGLMAYCGFPVKEFSMTYQKQNAQSEEKKQEPVAAETSAAEFTKGLDFSTFTTGITIPVKCHETFLANLSVNLERGQSHPVTLMIGEHRFQVSINNIGFSDLTRKRNLAFLWRRKSPIAKSFQSTFPKVFRQLKEDHANRTSIDIELTISCGNESDVFKITLPGPLTYCQDELLNLNAEEFQATASILEDPMNDKNLAELLQAEFANGVRPGSIIDQKKIRKLYRQYFDADLPEDFDFAAILPRVGIAHSGKVFPKPTSKQGGWRSLIDKLVSEGNTLFQFSRLVELHADELMKSGIGSGELLQKIMTRDALDSYDISGGFFAPRGLDAISCRFAAAVMPQEGAIIDILATAKQLPYVDTAYIRNWCKDLDNLVWIWQDVYAIAERIEFDDAEVARGRSCCKTAIAAEGFFSLSQLCLNDSAAMNDRRMTDSALRRVFFQRFLSDNFDAHGQIVCAKGANIDGQIPLHAFLQEHSDVTLDQLEAVAKEYNIVPCLALKTAHEEMTRVGRDRFVAPGMVPFDIVAIDSAIANVCEDVPMPFGSFTNLSNFPAVPGWTWNAYLLESFLRRSSAEFRFLSPTSFTKDPTGAVVPRKLDDCSTEDIFAAIARRCGVAAETEEVGNFLVATQCILRRTPKAVGAVVARMKELEKC